MIHGHYNLSAGYICIFYPIVLHAVRSAIGMITVSVCLTVCLSVTLCIVAKRHILQQKYLIK